MSLILDALRRADAERAREQGAVPGLHTQPLPSAGEPTRSKGWWWAAGGVLLAAIAAGVWWLRPTTPPAPAVVAPVAAPPVVAAAPVPQAAALPASAVAPTPAPPPPEPTAVLAAPPALPAAPVPAAPASTAPPQPAPPATPTVADVDLPLLPNARVGGVMYSDSIEGRLLIVNDLVLREGQSVSPGLVLERIGQHLATFRRGSERYKLAY